MTTPISSQKLVAALPRQLLSFFKRHPPASATSWAREVADGRSPQNPFRASKNTYTLKYNEPRYSIRRQTDLFKLASIYKVEHLLPPRVPHKEEKLGKTMKGLTRWKGTKMERTRDARIEAIRSKTMEAKKIVKARKTRTKVKKRRARTGLVLN